MGAQKCIAIVGNAPVAPGSAERIDASDLVVRFNKPKNSPENAGTRTDILFVANAGKAMQRRLEDETYPSSPHFQAARQAILPYDRDIIRRYQPRPNPLSWLKGRRRDWTTRTVALFSGAGKPVSILSAGFYDRCCDDLGIERKARRRVFPSTGFLATRYMLLAFPAPEWTIELHGFTWEGWKRHDWVDERAWIERELGHTSSA